MTERRPESAKERQDLRVLRGAATRARVLDAAERLFADQGFDAVSIRQIAQEAGVTLGVVGFHSGSKKDLFQIVLERRAAALSQERLASLSRLHEQEGKAASLDGIMRAYIVPYIAMTAKGDAQWQAYARLIARLVSDERWYPSVKDLYDPVARNFLDAIRAARPDLDGAKLTAAFVMSVSTMLSTVASTVRISGLADPEHAQTATPTTPAELSDVLVDFCVGGIEKAAHS